MKKIIGIEGSSYVGKTTVSDKLLEMGYNVIPEYDKFGPFPVSDRSVAGLKMVIDELLDRERVRSSFIVNDKINFEDRTPISLITFEEMRIICSNTCDEKKVHSEVRNYALSKINSLAESGKIILPDGIVVLRLKDKEEFCRRVEKRGITSVGELAVFETQLAIARSALRYSGVVIGNENNCAMIDVDNKDPQAVADEVLFFSNKAL